MSKFFPILINIKNQKCIVVGGGSVAERKIKTLLKYGAKIIVISPEITDNIKKLVDRGKIKHVKRLYRKGDAKEAVLVVSATSDSKINAQIAKEAEFLINTIEGKNKTKGIKYIVPAIFERGNLTIAVSTEFPSLSRIIRNEIAKLYGKEFALYSRYIKKVRKEIQGKIPDDKKRQALFRKIASKKIVSILKQDGFKEAKKEIDRILNEV